MTRLLRKVHFQCVYGPGAGLFLFSFLFMRCKTYFVSQNGEFYPLLCVRMRYVSSATIR